MRGMGRLGATPDDNKFSRLRDQSKSDFSTARADAFTGSEREEKASTRSGRNDRSRTRAIVRTWGAACCGPTQKMMAKGQRDLQLGRSAERALANDLALGESGLNWRTRAT